MVSHDCAAKGVAVRNCQNCRNCQMTVGQRRHQMVSRNDERLNGANAAPAKWLTTTAPEVPVTAQTANHRPVFILNAQYLFTGVAEHSLLCASASTPYVTGRSHGRLS